MALRDLLYRCPGCGGFPMEGSGDRVRCPGCRRAYLRGGAPSRIREVTPDGSERTVPASALVARIRDRERGPDGGVGAEGTLPDQAEVTVRRSVDEAPIRHRGRLLGFVERFGPGIASVLELKDEGLEVRGPDGIRWRWNLMDLRAIQASSSSLQIYTAADELVDFRFTGDSPLRWEGLMQEAVREAYRRRDRGEVLEFQPRITTR